LLKKGIIEKQFKNSQEYKRFIEENFDDINNTTFD
jgi:hypothetical protein